MTPEPEQTWHARAARVALPAGAALAALPFVSAAAALVLGAALALTLGNPWPAGTRRLAKALLPAAVVGLGGAMDLFGVLRAGASGLALTAVSLAFCGAVGLALARALQVRGATGVLVTVGTAICGGSAIAAAAPVIGAEDHETSVALAVVFLLNGAALLLFPPLGVAAGLDGRGFGLWAALAVHDTSSVVGAALRFGGRALEVATTTKLARALWIVPVTFALGWWAGRRRAGGAARPARPWFIAGFVAVAALTTLVPAARPAGLLAAELAKRVLVGTLFLIGAGLSRAALRQVGARPLVHGLVLWVIVAGVSLAAVRAGLGAG